MNKYIYPEAENWMWNYCIYLGPYESVGARKYDLGVYVDPQGLLSSMAMNPVHIFQVNLALLKGNFMKKRARVAGL